MLKTECGYNDDDFVERDGKLDELTVTITLNEYRNLISDIVCREQDFRKLSDEHEKLEQAFKSMVKYISAEKVTDDLKQFIEIITEV